MSHVQRLILTSFIFFSGCALFERQPESPDRIIQNSSKQKIFYANYDNVWRAAHSVIKYTIAVENQDFGILETEYIKGVDGWLPPDQSKPQFSGSRYKLNLIFARGKSDGRDSTRLTIEKKIEVLKDFISEPQSIPSDGLEEEVIFYRIGRELIIQDALKKAAETDAANAAPPL